MIDWETIKNTWPFVLVLGSHVVRTEVSRAVTKTRLANGEKNFERLEAQISALSRDMNRATETISADIKHLLERRP